MTLPSTCSALEPCSARLLQPDTLHLEERAPEDEKDEYPSEGLLLWQGQCRHHLHLYDSLSRVSMHGYLNHRSPGLFFMHIWAIYAERDLPTT